MPDATDWILLAFLFALGACLGSFLNVVVFRLPQIDVPESAGFFEATRIKLRGLSYPPSHCPRCGYALRWHDNFPILGWLWLGGKCRSCGLPISPQYPLIELLTALLFAGFYAAFFLAGPAWGPPTPAVRTPLAVPVVPGERLGPMNAVPVDAVDPASLPPGYALSAAWQEQVLPAGTVVPAPDLPTAGEAPYKPFSAAPRPVVVGGGVSLLSAVLRQTASVSRDWPALAIVLTLTWCLLAASLIDAKLFYIPAGLSYLPAVVGLVLHAVYDQPLAPLSLIVGPVGCAWAVGGGVGWALALALLKLGVLKPSFADEAPLLEVDRENAGQPEPTAAEWRQIKRVTRREMWREVAFLAPPVLLAAACAASAAYADVGLWESLAAEPPRLRLPRQPARRPRRRGRHLGRPRPGQPGLRPRGDGAGRRRPDVRRRLLPRRRAGGDRALPRGDGRPGLRPLPPAGPQPPRNAVRPVPGRGGRRTGLLLERPGGLPATEPRRPDLPPRPGGGGVRAVGRYTGRMAKVSDTFLKIRIGAKIAVLVIVLLYSLLFILLNNRPVELWLAPFVGRVDTSLLVAVLGAFVLGALLAVLVRMVFTTVRQIRVRHERQRTERLEHEIQDMRTKASTLQTRE